MNGIGEIIEIITRRVKSKKQARELTARFLQNNDEDTNWRFIIQFREVTKKQRVSGRVKRKIAEVEREILDYLCRNQADFEKSSPHFMEYVGEYEHILREEIHKRLASGEDIPLVFIPYFYPYPHTLIAIGDMGYTSLKGLAQSEEQVWITLFQDNQDLLEELVILLKSLGVTPNVPRC